MKQQTPIILHIPHSSREIPPELRSQFVLSDSELADELLVMTDAHTEDLFSDPVSGREEVVFPISRLVVDPERFLDDELEAMSKIGMGVVYQKTADGRDLRQSISNAKRTDLIARYYVPHHNNLERVVEEQLGHHNRCQIIDCHSFPDKPLPYESDQSYDRPDFCIGTDDFHTPESLVDQCRHSLKQLGYSVSLNSPFSGSLVPMRYYQKDKRVLSIMIEVNRRLYMDETTGARSDLYETTKADLLRVLDFTKELRV